MKKMNLLAIFVAYLLACVGIMNWFQQPQLQGWNRVFAHGTHFHALDRNLFTPNENRVWMNDGWVESHECDGRFVKISGWVVTKE